MARIHPYMHAFAQAAMEAEAGLVNLVAAQHEDYVLFSFDVSQAFAKGMTFKEQEEKQYKEMVQERMVGLQEEVHLNIKQFMKQA